MAQLKPVPGTSYCSCQTDPPTTTNLLWAILTKLDNLEKTLTISKENK